MALRHPPNIDTTSGVHTAPLTFKSIVTCLPPTAKAGQVLPTHPLLHIKMDILLKFYYILSIIQPHFIVYYSHLILFITIQFLCHIFITSNVNLFYIIYCLYHLINLCQTAKGRTIIKFYCAQKASLFIQLTLYTIIYFNSL